MQFLPQCSADLSISQSVPKADHSITTAFHAKLDPVQQPINKTDFLTHQTGDFVSHDARNQVLERTSRTSESSKMTSSPRAVHVDGELTAHDFVRNSVTDI
jgi:hypothetical protein